MDSPDLIGVISTVLPLVTFLGIVFWAWSRRRTAAFREAANAPFALPDDDALAASAKSRTEIAQ